MGLNGTDKAMITDGAEIDVEYDGHDEIVAKSCAWNGTDCSVNRTEFEYANNKAQARRKAVILCAAAKWDAMSSLVGATI